jgi:hypothetical protein
MQNIKGAGDIARIFRLQLDPELRLLLSRYAGIFEEFGEQIGAEILIISTGDRLSAAERICERRLVEDGALAFTPELIIRHQRWFEIVWIISDSGDGLVLFVEVGKGTDQELLQACGRALAQTSLQ